MHESRQSRTSGDLLTRAGTRAIYLLAIGLVAVAVIWLLLQVRLVLIAVLVALILASAIHPLTSWLRRRGWPTLLATLSAFLVVILVVGGLVSAVVLAISSEIDELLEQAAEGFELALSYVDDLPINIDNEQIDSVITTVGESLSGSGLGAGAAAGLSLAGELLTGVVLMIVVLFFFLKDGDRIWSFILRPFTGERLVRVRRAGDRMVEVFGGYLRGVAIVAFVDAFFIGIALFVLDVPLALPLAVLVFIGAFIPIVGATVTGALASVVALVTNGPVDALIVLGVVILVNQLEGNLLEPVVMGRTLKLHALVVLVALTIGTLVAGIVGAFLSIPLVAAAWAAIKVFTGDDREDDPNDPSISDREITEAKIATRLNSRGLPR